MCARGPSEDGRSSALCQPDTLPLASLTWPRPALAHRHCTREGWETHSRPSTTCRVLWETWTGSWAFCTVACVFEAPSGGLSLGLGPLVPGLECDDPCTTGLWLYVWCVWNTHQQPRQR